MLESDWTDARAVSKPWRGTVTSWANAVPTAVTAVRATITTGTIFLNMTNLIWLAAGRAAGWLLPERRRTLLASSSFEARKVRLFFAIDNQLKMKIIMK
jgi:hypothetical protein